LSAEKIAEIAVIVVSAKEVILIVRTDYFRFIGGLRDC
jgi:hypothetical protein